WAVDWRDEAARGNAIDGGMLSTGVGTLVDPRLAAPDTLLYLGRTCPMHVCPPRGLGLCGSKAASAPQPALRTGGAVQEIGGTTTRRRRCSSPGVAASLLLVLVVQPLQGTTVAAA